MEAMWPSMPVIEQAALVLSHSIISPKDKERLPPNPLLLHCYAELSGDSEAYCASLLLHEKQALFQVVLTTIKLAINTEPLAALTLSSFPCIENDASFHPDSNDRHHRNQLRILTCCVYCLFLCCLDADLQQEAEKEVEALTDIVVALVLQYSYQSANVPPICTKLENNTESKYSSDLLVEMLGPQPPRVGIALSFPSEQNNGDTIISRLLPSLRAGHGRRHRAGGAPVPLLPESAAKCSSAAGGPPFTA